MSLVSLKDVLEPAQREGYAIIGAVALGWEDAEAFVEAAEAVNAPIILQAGPKFRQTMPVEIIGTMFRNLGEAASIPVVAHVDHAKTIEECEAGIKAGFSSIMYDGSALPLHENIANTKRIVDMAKPLGISVEAEIGFVGYAEGVNSIMTDPREASKIAEETGIDALAVSVGNTHLHTSAIAKINFERLAEIEALTTCPLVMHGTSGIPHADRRRLAFETRVCKFNLGTEFRQKFGETLRHVLAEQPELFDRGEILRATKPAITSLAKEMITDVYKSKNSD